MKIIIALIKFILKILLILVGIAIFFSGIFLAMLYFSTPQYYTGFIEKAFVEGTGQQLKITGNIELKPGKKIETTLNSSVMTVKTNIGDVKIHTRNLYLAIPWDAVFNHKFDQTPIRASQVIIEIIKNEKVLSTYMASSVEAQIERSCCDVQFKDLKLVTKEGDLDGNIKVTPSDRTLKVTGNLHAKTWTINNPIDPKKKTLTFEGIKDLEGTIVFTIDTLHTPQGDMHNVEALIDLGAKSLTIQSSHVILSSSQFTEQKTLVK